MFPDHAVPLPAVLESEKHCEHYFQAVDVGGDTDWLLVEARWDGRCVEAVRADGFGAHSICCLHGARDQRDGPSHGGNSRRVRDSELQ